MIDVFSIFPATYILYTNVPLLPPQHANAVRALAAAAAREGRRLSGRWSVPATDVVWRPGVESGSFRARDNVSNFIR